VSANTNGKPTPSETKLAEAKRGLANAARAFANPAQPEDTPRAWDMLTLAAHMFSACTWDVHREQEQAALARAAAADDAPKAKVRK